MPVIQTKGAASSQGFGQFAKTGVAVYIEDVFSTYLYTGTGSAQTITNDVDLSALGGLVWMKGRSGATDHALYDTVRGTTKDLASNTTAAQTTQSTGLTAFGTTGFTIGALSTINTNTATYASWTFAQQPKFFDVVTYTGNGSNRTIAHDLGSVPGCIMVKRTDTTGDWQVYHRSTGNTKYLVLNSTAAEATSSARWNDTTPTSSVFSIGTDATVNANTGTYVAYLFAHDAGGFGLSGADNVISCGSFTTDGSGNATVTLGYEPQWVMTKNSSGESAWRMFDTMRGLTVAGQNDALLQANSSAAEITNSDYCSPTATGFEIAGHSGSATHIYIAIRRGPMAVPTDGTKVFKAVARTGTSTNTSITGVGFAPDFLISSTRNIAYGMGFRDKLRGPYPMLVPSNPAVEASYTNEVLAYNNTGVDIGIDTSAGVINESGQSYINWFFQRSPGFMDVVCYTGTGSATTFSHNLKVVPELIIVKRRDANADWAVYSTGLIDASYYLRVNQISAQVSNNAIWNSTAPTSTVFTVGTDTRTNVAAATYVAYLFATVAGVSKVGSYTGTGTTRQVNCGFTAGARFVLIKRTDSTGDWYVWDSTRGIVAGNDPYLLLNSTAIEVTSTDYVDTFASGFEISSTAPAEINANGGTFIFLAIA